MGTCTCAPPSILHVSPTGVHRPGGGSVPLRLADELWADGTPRCSVCALEIDTAVFRCDTCEAVICWACVSRDTDMAECDCAVEVAVTGVLMAARRASAQLGG